MKIDFQEWYRYRKFSGIVEQLFDEAVECFKFSAYRSAYIMSYLAFQTIIRNRILKDSKKSEYIDEDLLKILENDEKWEGIILHIVLKEERGNPFKLSYNVKTKYEYWKVIRNECAHGTNIALGYSEIETFWRFIQQNVDKFTINGGRENIINRLTKCFETRFEKSAYDIEDLEVIIEDTLRLGQEEDISELFEDINKVLSIKNSKTDKSEHIYKYWKGIIDSNNKLIYEYLLEFLKKDFNTFVYFLEVYPQLYRYIKDRYEIIRWVWKEKIIERLSNRISRNWEEAPWELLNKLLEDKLIPEEEIADFMGNLVRDVRIPHEISLDILKQTGYITALQIYLYSNSPYNFEFVNSKWDKIKLYLESQSLDKKTVEQIENKYRSAQYGDFKRGMDIMMGDEAFKVKYNKILL